MISRKRKAFEEPLYLISKDLETDRTVYHIVGSVGNVYKVVLTNGANEFYCDCPDHKYRKKTCKHMYFVELRVIPNTENVEADLHMQEKYISKLCDDLKEIANPKRKKSKPQRFSDNTECGICMSDMIDGQELVVCEDGCHNRVHYDCYKIWIRHSPKNQCIYCRTKINFKPKVEEKDYINVFDLE